MLKINSLFVLASAAILINGNAYAQDCVSCEATSYDSGCGYSSYSSCGGRGGLLGHNNPNHEHWQQVREAHAKIAARNDAWPKPFNCADRQLYHEVWSPMINGGFEEHCVLNSTHFDAETNDLNAFGLHAVAGIMQNMPTHRKQVFVNREADDHISQARLSNVQSVVSTYYGQIAPNAQVAYSSKMPASVTGARAEMISQKFIKGQPSPIIPISAGTNSVSSSVGQ